MRNETRALFIVIEGIDGSGSTTQGSLLTATLRSRGRRVAFTHEPSEGPVGAIIRLALSRRLIGPPPEAFLNGAAQEPRDSGLDQRTLALLYAADRRDHTLTAIEPNLRVGSHVVSDRYLLSSLAYQGSELDIDWLLEINRDARRPDLTILLDLPVDEALLRMRAARWTRDLFEEETSLRRVHSMYNELTGAGIPALGPIVKINASQPADELARHIRRVVVRFIETGDLTGQQGTMALFSDLDLEN